MNLHIWDAPYCSPSPKLGLTSWRLFSRLGAVYLFLFSCLLNLNIRLIDIPGHLALQGVR
jgi:hypothetical protein